MSDLMRETGAELVNKPRGAGMIPAEFMGACALGPELLEGLGMPPEDFFGLFESNVTEGERIAHRHHSLLLDHHIDKRYGPPDRVYSVVVHKNAFSILGLGDASEPTYVGHQHKFRVSPDREYKEPSIVQPLTKAEIKLFSHIPEWFDWIREG